MYGKKYLVFKLDVVFFSSYRWSTALSLSRHLNFKFYQHAILIRNINTNIFHCNIFMYIFGQKYYTISLLTLERIEWHLTHARCDYAIIATIQPIYSRIYMQKWYARYIDWSNVMNVAKITWKIGKNHVQATHRFSERASEPIWRYIHRGSLVLVRRACEQRSHLF